VRNVKEVVILVIAGSNCKVVMTISRTPVSHVSCEPQHGTKDGGRSGSSPPLEEDFSAIFRKFRMYFSKYAVASLGNNM
jgi:hypothetical protein